MKCCDCKAEEAVILTPENEVFCLDCYKQIVIRALREQIEFVYPNVLTILEGKNKRVFDIQHIITELGFLWIGKERDGLYEVKHLDDIGASFEGAYLGFVQKIVDTVYTKSIKKTFISTTWNVLKSDLGDVHLNETGQLSIQEDDMGRIYFIIDGQAFSPDDFAAMLAPYKGNVLQFQVFSPFVEVLKEDEKLVHKKK